jgi:lipopolysaccharide biosynthesis protein
VLWPEIDSVLRHICYPFDLHVTLTARSVAVADTIRQAFPGAFVYEIENHGRDIWPFIQILNKGILDPYRYVCKIHGKMSPQQNGETLFGARWRRYAFVELLAGNNRVDRILDRFDQNLMLGVMGPAGLYFSRATRSNRQIWGGNKRIALRLARTMGIPADELKGDFFAGSMFWFRPSALTSMRKLNLQNEDFPREKGQIDGTLQHAIERFFITVAVSAGYVVESVPEY